MYSHFDTLQVMCPVVFRVGQYLHFLVMQGLLGSRDDSFGGSLNLALTRMSFKLAGLRKPVMRVFWYRSRVEQDVPSISQFLWTIFFRP